jgi:ATP-dependent RNA/DNA helicase IGHMBP2
VAKPASPAKHLAELERLLQVEAQAEAEQMLLRSRRLSAADAERSGHTLTGLVVRDQTEGLAGRVMLTLAKRNQTLQLPWHRLTPGSPVLLAEEGVQGAAGCRGVVTARGDAQIEIACEQAPEPAADRPTFRLDLAGDEISRQRQRKALETARRAERGRLAQLRDILLGIAPPTFDAIRPLAPLAGKASADLNASQRAAVEFALSARDVAIIHGPPGTGKTTTVVEVIRQAVARGERVLALAASNMGVDNLLERLVRTDVRAVRLGHPARVLPELREHTLDLLVEAHPDLRVARQLVRSAHMLRDRAARYTRAKPKPGERQELRQEARELLSDARNVEERIVRNLLDNADVLCATLTGVDSRVLGERIFDLAVIDEAAQAVEPSCWIPLLRCARLVLAGDHWQLPPTIVSAEAAREGLQVSLPERLLEVHGPGIARRLTVQYRMHEAIMGFSSAEFYESSLIADASVGRHRLVDLPAGADGAQITASELTLAPLEFIDTAGASYDEELEPDGDSRRNPQEARLVVGKVQQLVEAGVAACDIGVITPYSAQVRLLRELLDINGVEVDSVDGFQGREKEAIVISLVRSNRQGEIGFLADTRRMNVALTRARRKLLVIGDSATIGGHAFYQRWLEYCEAQGRYGSVWDEP